MIGEVIACVLGAVLFIASVIGLPFLQFRPQDDNTGKISLLRFYWCSIAMAIPLILHLPVVLMRFRASRFLGHIPVPYTDDWSPMISQDPFYRAAKHSSEFILPMFSLFILGAVIVLYCDTRWKYLRLRDYWCIAFAFFVACFFVLGSSPLTWWLD